jgi:RNA polymerase sigma-70 factor, ECF subfamily
MQDAKVSERADAWWERVYVDTAPRLWRSLVGFAGDVDVANDAMSEAFAQAMRRGGAIRDPAAWVWRAAFRLAAGELKARRSASSAIPPAEDAADQQESALVEAQRLIEALRRLSPSQRAAVVLHHYAGFSVREIAGIIDSTGPAVRVHLSRGRARLRVLLEDRDA